MPYFKCNYKSLEPCLKPATHKVTKKLTRDTLSPKSKAFYYCDEHAQLLEDYAYQSGDGKFGIEVESSEVIQKY